MLNVVAPSLTGELKAKKKPHSEPKYSFEELSDEGESSGKIPSIYNLWCYVTRLTSYKIDGGVVNSITQSHFHGTMF